MRKSVRKIGQKAGQKVEAVFELIKESPAIMCEGLSKKLGKAPSSIQRYTDILKIDRIRRIDGDRGGHREIIE